MPTGIYIRTEETKRILSLAHKGKKLSPEHLRRRMEGQSGIKHPRLGKKHSTETKIKIGMKSLGRTHTLESRLKLSEKTKGANGSNWKGGLTEISQIIRCSARYKIWREAVFKRDNWTCVICSKKGGNLNADHIKKFADYPELRFSIDNGRTLCVPCHKATDTYGSKKKL